MSFPDTVQGPDDRGLFFRRGRGRGEKGELRVGGEEVPEPDPHGSDAYPALICLEEQFLQGGVEVKLVPGPDGEETFILARSADRQKKEKAMRDRFLERMEGGLAKLRTSAENGRLKDAAVVP